jgi:hypothetical protein
MFLIIFEGLAANGTMMQKTQILRTREVDVMGDYCALMIHLAPSMVPGREWEMVKGGYNTFSQIVTSTDEAHGLLVIENNWNLLKFGDGLEGEAQKRCEEMEWITKEEHAKYGITKPRYTRTDGGRPRNGRQGKTGWSQDGMDRFNELVDLVRKGRAIRGNAFNAKITKKCREMADEKSRNRKRKRARSREEEAALQKLEQFHVACDFDYDEM